MSYRDEKRIDKFCTTLAYYWHKAPDFRFGQLITNVFGYAERDVWFMEEDEMLKLFETFFTPAKREEAEKRIEEREKQFLANNKDRIKTSAIRAVLSAFDIPANDERIEHIKTRLERFSEAHSDKKQGDHHAKND